MNVWSHTIYDWDEIVVPSELGDAELNEKFLAEYHQQIAGKTWADFDHETVEKHNQNLARYLKMHPDTSLSTAKNIVGHTPWLLTSHIL